MPFCKECGKETPENELKSHSGYCQICFQSQLENRNEESLYPKFYPRELKYLKEDKSSKNQRGSFETTPMPSMEEIKRLSKYKRKISMGVKEGYLIIVIIALSLPFIFPFYFISTIANSLAVDYSYALINTYVTVALYTNLIYYGIIGLCFLIGGFAGLVKEDTDLILPVGICFSIIFIIIGVIFGNILWGNLAPQLFAYLMP